MLACKREKELSLYSQRDSLLVVNTRRLAECSMLIAVRKDSLQAALKGPLWSYAYVPKFLRRCYIRVLTDIPGRRCIRLLKAELWGQVERAAAHSSRAARYRGFVTKNLTEEFLPPGLRLIETFLLFFERAFSIIMKIVTWQVMRETRSVNEKISHKYVTDSEMRE